MLDIETTGKSLSKALILAATNPQYVKRLFIDLGFNHSVYIGSIHENYKLRIWGEHVVHTNCFFVLTFRTIFAHNMFYPGSELVVFMY